MTAHRTEYPVRRLCHALRISTSGYYAACGRPVSPRGQRQAALTARIEHGIGALWHGARHPAFRSGSLYAMAQYRAMLNCHGIRQSMSRKGNCWDNAPMESFFHTLKTKLVMHCDYQTREQARASLFEYMEVFYNRQRRHSSLHYANPLDFEVINQPLIRVSTELG